MKAAMFVKPGEIKIVETPKPQIQSANDAIIKVVRTCVCGSDLWWYRGLNDQEPNTFVGHEAIGVVQEVGTSVTNICPGDFVIVPFTHGCGNCIACQNGFDGNCLNQQNSRYNTGYQAEYLRYNNADWGLVKIPGQPDDYSTEQLNSLLALSDVMATGYHASCTAEVQKGDTVVVIGDGAVGLCGVIAAKLRGAQRIIIMSRHQDRQELAIEFGATDIIVERGDTAVQKVMDLTAGAGADAILECVGTTQSLQTAVQIGCPGALVGRVGVPQQAQMDTAQLFWHNTGLRGGIASVTTYDKNILLQAVLDQRINPGKVFTQSFKLTDIQQAYEAMDQRTAIKSLITF
ncbi:zinc-dependent alcohol dehydrogenase family protein [Bombilactobacillus thymidiniphilus]|uniref:Zinc-dependent alcohol dehydrogenase family protein n=1 Tax=Bombilactobacillus thymidiniphilus TaxID=2923363 RepID=A0ABY4PDV3_9LACO|nr:zinc-dependent alcohol dehydrogenase family protein [Bombilactobacillus thymidiniphilus]UQS83958.1 zinc-dependent alcohol dehydrogenase family protein [Bombilactobacillus thymidiniphilus]